MKRIIEDHSCSVFLMPGRIVLSRNPVLVSTLLGSCVAVTMHAPEVQVGAICHAMLPCAREEGNEESLLYVDGAVRHLYRRVREYAGTSRLNVKLFGGARVLAFSNVHDRLTVGEQNILAAQKVLDELGLAIAGSDVGGSCGRKLFFSMMTGRVYLKKMNPPREPCCRDKKFVPPDPSLFLPGILALAN